jgi:carboxymethylenebutenolidase
MASERAVDIKTEDGNCDAVLVHRGGSPSPAVIWYPDGFGLRPTHVDMAKRLAGHGYAVLVINPFYRARRAPVHPPGFDFNNPEDRAQGMKLIQALDHSAVTRDATAFIGFLDAQPEVNAKARVGAVGFCMGGAMTVRAAAAVPERMGASASFHGGGLVTDDPNSPHRLVAKTQAAYHIQAERGWTAMLKLYQQALV